MSTAFRVHDPAAAELAAAIDDYAFVRALAPSTAYQWQRAGALFGQWLGRPALVGDLDARVVSAWLADLETTHARGTVARHRANLLTVWRELAERGVVDPPARVRRVRRPAPLPVAWSLAELRRIVAACERVAGRLPWGVARADYFVALTCAAYDSGLRRSDLWALDRVAIRDDGSVVLRQRKTGRPHVARFTRPTLARVVGLPGDRPLQWHGSPSWFYQCWKRIVAEAGVRHGSLQQIRRTAATHLAIEHPDGVSRFLGHASPDMRRHYVDESIANPSQFQPPPLFREVSP